MSIDMSYICLARLPTLATKRIVLQVSDPGGNDAEELGFDQILGRLEEVVGRLERGNLSLEDALRAYEEGIGLARRGHAVLDGAEKRVELLVGQDRDGETTIPLDPEGAQGEDDPDGRDQ